MSKLIINCETGEVTERELNDKEIAQNKKDTADSLTKQNALIAEAEAKAAQKAALLERLGITEDEARLLLG
jgi:hypothetical protein